MEIRDRIKELRRVKASDLKPNPKNWRGHGDTQRNALSGVLEEIGYAGAIVAYEGEGGGLTIIDGHLRADISGEETVPVLVLDVDEKEADLLLATLDPLTGLATEDEEALHELIEGIHTDNDEVEALLDLIDEYEPEDAVTIKNVPIDRPPAMTWVLIGIPTVNYNAVSEQVDAIAQVHQSIVEVSVGDETPED